MAPVTRSQALLNAHNNSNRDSQGSNFAVLNNANVLRPETKIADGVYLVPLKSSVEEQMTQQASGLHSGTESCPEVSTDATTGPSTPCGSDTPATSCFDATDEPKTHINFQNTSQQQSSRESTNDSAEKAAQSTSAETSSRSTIPQPTESRPTVKTPYPRGSAQRLETSFLVNKAYAMVEHLQPPAKLFGLLDCEEPAPVTVGAGNGALDALELRDDLLAVLEKDSSELATPTFHLLENPSSVGPLVDRTIERAIKRIPGDSAGKDHHRRKSDLLFSFNGLNANLKPLSNIRDIFADLTSNAISHGLLDFLRTIGARKLKVCTLCSGTESPLLALQLISECLEPQQAHQLHVEHQFSCEIEPFKQAYIVRNFRPALLFRDVMDLKHERAHTAFGSLEAVPGGADIMIAGSSCIDFSGLNCKPKTFGMKGESYDTLLGIVTYAKTHQPNIVILENVYGFAWGEAESMWHEIGYATQVALLDTKDFYIPQTRQRGYMIGLRRAAVKERHLDLDPDKAVRSWFTVLTKLQRRASSPFTDFIFSEGNAELQRWSQMDGDNFYMRSPTITPWEKCRTESLAYRASMLLGFKRPFTNGENKHSCNVSDACNHLWFRRQSERIRDTIDINQLRNVHNWWWDFFYKYRCMNVSQTCLRELDDAPWGIVRCITAHASLYLSHRGGPLAGPEALALQGIPIEKLILSRETNKQLIDLAGNAMSTTTVGACILAAMISCQEIFSSTISFDDDNDDKESSKTSGLMETSKVRSLAHDTNWLLVETDMTAQNYGFEGQFATIQILAYKTRRYCSCEGPLVDLRKSFQQCSLCGHTSCVSCGGKPLHRYRPISSHIVKDRKSTMDFEESIRQVLPVRLIINAGMLQNCVRPRRNIASGTFDANTGVCYTDEILAATKDIYHLVHIKRSREWNILYNGRSSCLVLTFRGPCSGQINKPDWALHEYAQNVSAQWTLYAKPDPELPANSCQRANLSHPVARLSCSTSLMNGQWEVRTNIKRAFQLLVVGGGRKVPSWERKLGLEHPRFRNHFVWSTLDVRKFGDNDESEEIPEQILGSYDLAEDCGTACGSLHVKRNTARTLKERPVFLFLDPAPLGNASFDSFVFAHEHHRLERGEVRPVLAKVDAGWRPSARTSETIISCESANSWLPAPSLTLSQYVPINVPKVSLASAGTIAVLKNSPCRGPQPPVIWAQLPINPADQRQPGLDSNRCVDLVKEPFALENYSWLLKDTASRLHLAEWQDVALEPLSADRCLQCAPRLPSVVWRCDITWKGMQVRPYENVEEASEYERNIQRAPAVVTGHYCHDDVTSTARLKVTFNIMALVHKAVGTLLDSSTTLPSISSVQWRAVVDHGEQYPVPFPQVQIKDCEPDAISAQPPTFATNGQALDEAQCRSLTWMKKQEAAPHPWYEQEVAEAVVPRLDVRLEAKVTARRDIRGGVLADDVGYGKTALVLGLIDNHLHHMSTGDEPLFVPGQHDMIDVKATLILVPAGLTAQWRSEIYKFLGSKFRVLELRKDNLERLSRVSSFQKADIILAGWDLLEGSYIPKLARMSKAVNCPSNAGRGFEEWFRMAQEDLKTLIKQSHGLKEEHYLAAWRNLKERDYKRFQGLSKRNKKGTGLAEEAKVKPQSKRAKTQADDSQAEEPNSPFLPLHGCRFSRLVVDEFTYLGSRVETMVAALQASRRWILSGTPPYNSFQGVNGIARLFGTSIGTPDDAAARYRRIEEGKVRNVTGGEALRSYATIRSPSWQRERFAVAAAFIDKFVRKSKVIFSEIRTYQHFERVRLTASERAIYSQAFLLVVNQGIRAQMKRSAANTGQARTDWLMNHIASSTSAEEALIVLCSVKPQLAMDCPSLYDCRGVVQEKGSLIRETIKSMYSELQGAFWLKNFYNDGTSTGPELCSYLRSVERNSFGDGAVRDLLAFIIAQSQQEPLWRVSQGIKGQKVKLEGLSPIKKQYQTRGCEDTEPRQLTPENRVGELKMRAQSLTQATFDLVDLVRERRFLLVVARCENNMELACSRCGELSQTYDQMFIMGRCGHATCSKCHWRRHERAQVSANQCSDKDCESSCLPEATIRASDLDNGPSPNEVGPDGSKMTAIARLLTQIPPEEKVLIFGQFEPIINSVREMLADNQVRFVDTTGSKQGKQVADVVRTFQTDTECRVCILQQDSCNAAGWNLQVANHVIFVSPLVVKSRHEYRSMTTQALGRVLRRGQQHDVHVYHFVADKTLEVSILEERAGKRLVEREGQGLVLVKQDDIRDGDLYGFGGLNLGTPGQEGSGLSDEHDGEELNGNEDV